ncbi:MAG: hypothetical protein E7557_02930 [Ruminococcaceae bacterium]|nr:hypothetical protein [Oscillospiraceae bacterium]
MVAFFCATPVQIYQIINIRTQYYNDKETILYILDYFLDAEKYVEKCKETGLFKDVVFVKMWKCCQRTNGKKYKDLKILKGVQKKFFDFITNKVVLKKIYMRTWCIYYFFLKNDILKKLHVEKSADIEEVLFSYYDPILPMLYLKLKNKKMKFNRFEDGTSTYFNGVNFAKCRFDEKIGLSDDVFKPAKVFAHFPEAIKDIEKANAEIIKVDFSQNKVAKDLLYKIFDIENVQEIKEKVIFFDTLAPNQNMEAMMKPLSIFTSEEIVYKKHPRRPDRYYEERNLNVYKGASLPFEMYCEYFDVSDKILVSHCSTACVSPALFFNQTPTAIICYDFATTKGLETYSGFDAFLNRLLENDVPLKLSKPKTKEEYEKLIFSLKSSQ